MHLQNCAAIKETVASDGRVCCRKVFQFIIAAAEIRAERADVRGGIACTDTIKGYPLCPNRQRSISYRAYRKRGATV
jgi:hypothetical protein